MTGCQISLSATPCFASCRGFTLIELLIAVVIMTVGLLSVANLQILSTQGNFEGMQRTQATMFANNVIARMRANSERLDTYASSDLASNTKSEQPSGCTDTMGLEDCMTAIANYDRWELQQSLAQANALITPIICITHDNVDSGNVKVAVAWRGMTENTATIAAEDEEGGVSNLDDCGQDQIDNTYLKQFVINTYITPLNPY